MQSRTEVKRHRSQAGQMGLISLLVTIAIIAIVAAIMYPKVAGRSEYDVAGDQVGEPSPIDDANDTACITYQGQVRDAISMYVGDHGHPPRSLQDLKKYGVTNDIINTPNCNFQLPKYSPQEVAPAPSVPASNSTITYVTPASTAPQVAAPQSGPQQQGDDADTNPEGANSSATQGLNKASAMARYGVQASGYN